MSESLEIRDYRWLVSEEAERWFSLAREDCIPLHRRAARLRQSLSAERTHLVLQLTELRVRAREKFSRADRLFFTPVGLAQATDEWIARYKATRFPKGAAVADLCCGVGGDLMGLRSRGGADGCDRDPIVSLFAAENARRTCDGTSGGVSCADAEDAHLRDYAAWHIDPDRRDGPRRTVDPAHMAPPREKLERLLAVNGNAAVKLSPATTPPAAWDEQAELEWIGRSRECRQLVAWFGSLADSPGLRRATVLDARGAVVGQVLARPEAPPPPATTVLDFVCEPDPAVLAAGLAGHLARSYDLLPLAPDIPYFTSSRPIQDGLLAWFRVQSLMRFDEKRLASALRAQGIGQLEIKHRGVLLEPERLRRNWKIQGDGAAVLIVTRHGGQSVAMLAQRVNQAECPQTDS